MGTRIQIRRDTSTNWSLNNPVLALGEPGLETDTQIVKYGDGVTAWNSLPYANLNSLADFTTANLAENSANLYYTNARVYSNVITLGTIARSFTYDQMTSLNAANGTIILETSNNVFRGFNGTNWTILG